MLNDLLMEFSKRNAATMQVFIETDENAWAIRSYKPPGKSKGTATLHPKELLELLELHDVEARKKYVSTLRDTIQLIEGGDYTAAA